MPLRIGLAAVLTDIIGSGDSYWEYGATTLSELSLSFGLSLVLMLGCRTRGHSRSPAVVLACREFRKGRQKYDRFAQGTGEGQLQKGATELKRQCSGGYGGKVKKEAMRSICFERDLSRLSARSKTMYQSTQFSGSTLDSDEGYTLEIKWQKGPPVPVPSKK
ncbi:hypothetical protein B0H19DRAFT_1079955 [Mycena capillaripes]|nr:hypothetical protein B0H19DRAFT_1079955 [Mycena capillaripes]